MVEFILSLLRTVGLCIPICLQINLVFGSSGTPSCRVAKCDFHLTAEHSAQISTIQELSLTETGCLTKYVDISLPDVFAVYCPEETFCGIDLRLESSKELKPFYGRNCSVFATEMTLCQEFERNLKQSGYFLNSRQPPQYIKMGDNKITMLKVTG